AESQILRQPTCRTIIRIVEAVKRSDNPAASKHFLGSVELNSSIVQLRHLLEHRVDSVTTDKETAHTKTGHLHEVATAFHKLISQPRSSPLRRNDLAGIECAHHRLIER